MYPLIRKWFTIRPQEWKVTLELAKTILKFAYKLLNKAHPHVCHLKENLLFPLVF